MKIRLLLFTLLLHLTGFGQSPRDFLKPNVWLRADIVSDTAKFWKDASGNSLHAVSEKKNALISDSLINFNKAIRFNDGLKFNIPVNLSTASQITVITVYNSGKDNEEGVIWGADVVNGNSVSLSTQKLKTPNKITKYVDKNISIPVINTSSMFWEKSDTEIKRAEFILGATTDSLNTTKSFSGSLAELMIFDRLVTGEELDILQSYLAIKYGTTNQYSTYLSSDKKELWNYETNKNYSHAIAALGRDDGLNLYQKQSSNSEYPNLLTIGADSIYVNNDSNKYELRDANFLMWGMNSKPSTIEKSEEEIYPYDYPVMNRKWKMNAIGSDVRNIPTELKFNIKEEIGLSEHCYLIIDRTGAGDFASEDIEAIESDTIIDGVATFSNINWNGSNIFTLSFGIDSGVECTHPLCHDELQGIIDMQIMGGTAPYKFKLTCDSLDYEKSWSDTTRFQKIENLQYGDYFLVVHDKDGNVAKNEVTIYNPDEFTLGLEKEYSLKMGETLSLDATTNISENGVTFKWQSDNGYYSEDKLANITQPGDYSITVSNEYGCNVSDTITVNPSTFYSYSLYPNPSTSGYNLNIVLAEATDVDLKIFDMSGALYEHKKLRGSANYSVRGDIDGTGVFIVEIKTKFGVENFKLVIQ